MFDIRIIQMEELVAFWLVFTRWLAVLFQLPLFDAMPVPSIVKVLITLLVSYTFFPYVSTYVHQDITFLGVENFWALTIFYTLVGLILGYFVKAIFNIYLAAGDIISQQMGFGAAKYFDPSTGAQVSSIDNIIKWTILVLLASSGALIPMFKGVNNSFQTIHMFDFGNLSWSPEFFLKYFKSIFLSGLMLATPLIFTNMLINAILGIVARTVPQLNVIMVSFVVNISLGLLVFAMTGNEFFQVAFRLYTEKLGEWFNFI